MGGSGPDRCCPSLTPLSLFPPVGSEFCSLHILPNNNNKDYTSGPAVLDQQQKSSILSMSWTGGKPRQEVMVVVVVDVPCTT